MERQTEKGLRMQRSEETEVRQEKKDGCKQSINQSIKRIIVRTHRYRKWAVLLLRCRGMLNFKETSDCTHLNERVEKAGIVGKFSRGVSARLCKRAFVCECSHFTVAFVAFKSPIWFVLSTPGLKLLG